VKKLSFGKSVDIKEAICDWCGEEKECFESTRENNHIEKDGETECLWVATKGYKYVNSGLLGLGVKCKWLGMKAKVAIFDWDYKTTTVKSHICKDCAKQMAKTDVIKEE
jgi:hypothetical protein